MNYPFSDMQIKQLFDSYPTLVRRKLLDLRNLIFEEASRTDGVGNIEETLKWGQPSYLTSESKSGTTIRIDKLGTDDSKYALYVHCQTNLIDMFRDIYPNVFDYEKNRAIVLDAMDEVPEKELSHCIGMALTYHLRKKRC